MNPSGYREPLPDEPSEQATLPCGGGEKAVVKPDARGADGAVPLLAGDRGIVSVQFGAAIAKDLFPVVPPTAMVWLRLVTSAVIFLLVARPRVRGRTGRDWLVAPGFGVSLMTMNWAIYQSFARIPLGIAVTIEFLGPPFAILGAIRRQRSGGAAGVGVGPVRLPRKSNWAPGSDRAARRVVCLTPLSAQTGRTGRASPSRVAIWSAVCWLRRQSPRPCDAAEPRLWSWAGCWSAQSVIRTAGMTPSRITPRASASDEP